jgi:ribosomal protein S18 acetylase RimI-like enzyme
MDVTIRQIGSHSEPREAERYINAYLRLFNDPENLKYLSFTGIPFARETVEEWLRGADASNVEYHTAFGDDGQICAILCTRSNPIEGFEIMALVVGEACRRAGVGRTLLEVALSTAREKGFRAVSAAVFADNQRMLPLLIKSGFKPCKIEPCARWDGEDIVCLKKIL